MHAQLPMAIEHGDGLHKSVRGQVLTRGVSYFYCRSEPCHVLLSKGAASWGWIRALHIATRDSIKKTVKQRKRHGAESGDKLGVRGAWLSVRWWWT
jgi:hypothetical protein